MAYRIRDGIVLVQIQDVYLIVASAPYWDECPFITETNEMGAFIWRGLENHKDIKGIVNQILDEYDIDDRDSVEYDVTLFIQNMTDANYLIPERKDVE